MLERRAALVRTATTLTAGDAHRAEDIVQAVLVRLYVNWPRVREQRPDAYARRAIVNEVIDDARRPGRRREIVSDRLPEPAVEPVPENGDLLEALGALPPRMRTAVVLRYVEGLSIEDTADAMACSTGTVKSQAARGLDKLRTALGERVSA